MNKQYEKYSNAACPNCKQVGTKHGVYLCESYGDYQSDKCKVIVLTEQNQTLQSEKEMLQARLDAFLDSTNGNKTKE